MNREIEIPSDYEARIEGNKIILESKKGKDKEIKEELISFLRTGQPYFCPNTNKRTEWANWVEKQKEQNVPGYKTDDYFCEKCQENAYNEGKKAGLAEQKPAEWSEEDIKKIRSEEYTKGFNDAAFGGKLKEWSQEDEDRIRQIERIAQQAGCTQKLQEEIHDWLKSLRPQPKQEWSEEDDNALNYIHELISFGFTENFMDAQTAADMREWLNNHLNPIYPQPHWKPSEEQMEYLAKAIIILGDEGDCKTSSILNELRIDLKKLI